MNDTLNIPAGLDLDRQNDLLLMRVRGAYTLDIAQHVMPIIKQQLAMSLRIKLIGVNANWFFMRNSKH